MNALNLLVFRGEQRRVSGAELKALLARSLELLCGWSSPDRSSQELSSPWLPENDVLLRALLLAGELECGMADAAPSARPSELLTDGIAEQFLRPGPAANFPSLTDAARALAVRGQLSISASEGFAYYALHPLAYAEVLDRIPVPANSLMVVGIRTIGTTLSAVTAASARMRGLQAQRITVRPQGHPYNRRTEFAPRQLAMVNSAVSSGATFAVVDEGPGLSGSSFLSVAEALEQAGAPREKIVLVGSHAPNVDALCASDAALRWRRYRNVGVAGETRRPPPAVNFVGAGQWRSHLLSHESEWPASWTSFERPKYLSAAEYGGPRLFKFAGLGHYGDQVFEREEKAAASGFAPPPRRESDGFLSYPWIHAPRVNARPMAASDASKSILARLAEYCAFRLRTFSVGLSDLNALQQMAEHNMGELGIGLGSPAVLRLERPVIADGRMQPHEWLLTKEGRLLKTDSGSHGDDHFFPGPADIAWDLAGAIVEWRMDEQQAEEFLYRYRRSSGDDASARIRGFIQAYAVFRCAYCMMAAGAMPGSEEQSRMDRAAAGYKTVLMQMETQSLEAA